MNSVEATMETMASTTNLPADETDDRAVVVRLLWASGLMLFLELALIRWLGSNIVHLSYFSNFVLLGSFLGIGAGFLISRREWSIWPIALPLLAILVIGVINFPVSIERQGSDLIYFTALEIEGPPAWLALPIIFVLVAVILAGPAELVGRCFAELRPLSAYRYDLIGSLAGILGFTALSFLHAPSLVWGLVAMVPIMVLTRPARRLASAGWAVILLAGLAMETFTPGVTWSPYYKIHTEEMERADAGFVMISANGVTHQLMAPADWKLEQGERIYETPYLRLPHKLDDVLIVGAGSGSDVAIALSKGAKHVDAVDIDPQIMQIGVDRNIDRPYANPGVVRHVNDGRAFLQNTDRKYDLVLFALPDSLTLVSGASQIRLETFLFTEEAMASVRRVLKPDGAFAMYNYYREPWLIDRLAGTAQKVFGHEPCVDTWADAQAVVSVAMKQGSQSCDDRWVPTSEVTTVKDDAPFLYFRGTRFPPVYAITIAAILLASLVTVRVLGGPLGTMRPYADLFFMGAAFLLLETKNIATFALLFGTTWFVNALVFAGVLVIVLAAVETERRVKTPPLKVVFLAMAVSLAAAWIVKPEWLLSLAFWPRLVAATVLAFLPIYLANIAFAKRFRESGDSQSAFAINLLGTIVGGCLEYAALFTGYNNLLILTGLLYLVAFLLVPKGAARMA
ncbi:spermidine synthase [Qipengyuania sp.]|uniref:spermine/spermidine synthase domain-containing protein n=1 Tax=Qipengyuania sp. TaxID=2004515 RepID=UPI003515190B